MVNDVIAWLPLLNVPVFWIVVRIYVKTEVRLVKLEEHKRRVDLHLGFNERSTDHNERAG